MATVFLEFERTNGVHKVQERVDQLRSIPGIIIP